MITSNNNSVYIVKKIKKHNLFLLIRYLFIRYKVFVGEFARPVIGEFSADDIIANHYVFLVNNQEVGIARIIYKNYTAEIGRVALLKEHRNKGYGTKLINQIICNIKNDSKVSLIRLFTEDKNVSFYKKFGFIEKGEVYFDNIPYINMVKSF